MTHKLVPDEEARRLTAEQIIGRRVVHDGTIQGFGTVTSLQPGFSGKDVVRVVWHVPGQEMAHAWGRDGQWHIKLVAEESDEEAYETIPEFTTMSTEEAKTIPADKLIGLRVVRGPDWNPAEDLYDSRGKSAGTIRSINGTGQVVYVEWDGLMGAHGHYFGGTGKYEVAIVSKESKMRVKKQAPVAADEVRPYDPKSPWERPNLLVLAMFASEFEETRKTQ